MMMRRFIGTSRTNRGSTSYRHSDRRSRKGKAMRTLLMLDEHNYTEQMPVFEKYSTRAVIIRDGKLATQRSLQGDYKLLGGGAEPGESLPEALIREVREESGLIVIPESIREIGQIIERRRDIFEPDEVYVCHSCFFFCDVLEEMTETQMTESERQKGYHLEWATPEEIIAGNEPFCKTQPWSYRDSEFVRMLPQLFT